jgi:UDP-N-acetylglucosamine 2-epimerase
MSAQKNLRAATVVGARPQLIKVVVVSRALRSAFTPKQALIHLLHTGQHHNENNQTC